MSSPILRTIVSKVGSVLPIVLLAICGWSCVQIFPVEPSDADMAPRAGNRIIFGVKYSDGTTGVDWIEADGSRRQNLLGENWSLASQPMAGLMVVVRPASGTGIDAIDTVSTFDTRSLQRQSVSGMAFESFVTVSLSPDAAKMLVISRYGYMSIANVNRASTQGMSYDSDLESPPLYSPDGSNIAFVDVDRWNGRQKPPRVAIISTGGVTSALRDTVDTELGVDLAWSPDSREIVYADIRPGTPNRLTITSIDDKRRRTLPGGIGSDFRPQWSPDGSRIVFTTGERNGSRNIAIINVDGSGRTNLTNSVGVDEDFARWSPDGSKLLYLTSGASPSLMVMDMITGTTTKIAGNISGPAYWDYRME